ncbi:hypothetical protein Mapa_002569 [Marchantia paleacea]|nr:hypothetical protein Mapa_002569 [Marchantia paleacea]
MYSERVACFEHSNFFKVISPTQRPDRSRPVAPAKKKGATSAHQKRRTADPLPRSNYELFNCNNLNIRY